ncbi:MAG: ferritin [Chloroflexi bacterium]|nr:ferritin [Chloroflexota bacterium]
MLSEVIQQQMNEQLKAELYSANVYLAQSAYFESISLSGFAHWTREQAREETGHAMKFFDYINDRNGRVILKALDQPAVEFDSPQDAFEKALAHEQEISTRINQLYALAVQEHDYASEAFLQWFIKEQVEEEKTVRHIVEMLKMGGGQGPALLLLDRDFVKRPQQRESSPETIS